MVIDRSNDITRLRIVGNYEDDSRKNIDRITKEINRELSKIEVSRTTAVDITPLSVNKIAGTQTFNGSIIVANATIVDGDGDVWEIASTGSGLITPRIKVIEKHVGTLVAGDNAFISDTCPAGATGCIAWVTGTLGSSLNPSINWGGTSMTELTISQGGAGTDVYAFKSAPTLADIANVGIQSCVAGTVYGYHHQSTTGTRTLEIMWVA